MKKLEYLLIISVFIIIIYVLAACNSEQFVSDQNLTKLASTPPTTMLATDVNGPNIQVATRTIKPTELSGTPTPTLFVTNQTGAISTPLPQSLTPLPILTEDQAQELVLELMKNNAGCELPCFWRIIPGETSWQNAYLFLSSFTYRIDEGPIDKSLKNGIENLTASFQVYNNIPSYSDPISSRYLVTNGIVEKIDVFPRGTELRYQIHTVLTEYGFPDEVLLFLSDVSPAGKPWFYFYIFYVEKGITAIYNNEAQFNEDIFEACPKGLGPELILIPPGSQDLDTMKRNAYDVPFRIPSINDFPGKSIESFYETMKVPGTCLRVDPNVMK